MLKSTGIVRKVDELGRIVLPIELRRTLEISVKDSLEIYVEGNTVVLKKYEPACIFCGNAKNVTTYKEKILCADCIDQIVSRSLYRESQNNAREIQNNTRDSFIEKG